MPMRRSVTRFASGAAGPSSSLASSSTSSFLPRSIAQTLRLASTSESKASATTIHGWVASLRVQKNIAFLRIQDGSSASPLQVVVRGSKEKDPSGLRFIVDRLRQGASVKVTGTLTASLGAEQPVELRADALEILGACDAETYPLGPLSKHGAERSVTHLRDVAHLRMRDPEQQAAIKLRDRVGRAWRDYFEDLDFVHIDTPVLTSSDCEGAGEMFAVTSPTSPASDPFFPPPGANLTVSSQLHLELYLPAHANVWTLSPCFRAERSTTSRHLAEFTMLEAECAFLTSLDPLLELVERGVRRTIDECMTRPELAILFDKPGVKARLERVSLIEGGVDGQGRGRKWPRITYTEAISRLQARHAQAPFSYEPRWGSSLATEHERWLAAEAEGPIFVTDYPAGLKPFYMLPSEVAEDYSRPPSEEESVAGRETVACFDLLVPEVGELAGGSLREHRLEPLMEAMKVRDMRVAPLEWYLDTRRFGSVPHGGFGLGFERLLVWLSGARDVRDVVGFPRWKGSCRY